VVDVLFYGAYDFELDLALQGRGDVISMSLAHLFLFVPATMLMLHDAAVYGPPRGSLMPASLFDDQFSSTGYYLTFNIKPVQLVNIQRRCIQVDPNVILSDEVYPRQCPCLRGFDSWRDCGIRRTQRRSINDEGHTKFTQVHVLSVEDRYILLAI
jgi:hypothetical protein